MTGLRVNKHLCDKLLRQVRMDHVPQKRSHNKKSDISHIKSYLESCYTMLNTILINKLTW